MPAWLRPQWLLGHIVVAVVAVACLRLGWWQWQQAQLGNGASYGYAAQWPLFAAFGVFFWTRVVRERVSRVARPLAADASQVTVTVGPSWSFRRGKQTRARWRD